MAESDELIIPPKKVYAIIEKTAQHVASKGDSFEDKIRASGNNKKFGFLEPENPYYAFYKEAVRLFRAGETGTCARVCGVASGKYESCQLVATAEWLYLAEQRLCAQLLLPRHTGPRLRLLCYASTELPTAAPARGAETTPDTSTVAQSTGQATSDSQQAHVIRRAEIVTPLAAAHEAIPSSGTPPALSWLLPHPVHLSAKQQQRMLLTAQYAAVGGKVFLDGLRAREGGNPEFAFVHSSSPLFKYFTDLVSMYKLVLVTPTSVRERLQTLATTPLSALTTALWRVKLRQADEAAKAERLEAAETAAADIDWHNFVVVHTIDLDEMYIARPKQVQAQITSASGRAASAGNASDASSAAMDTDDDAMDISDGEDAAVPLDDEQLNIQPHYNPASMPAAQPAPTTFIDPTTGLPIAAADAEQHFKVKTMDPQWAVQQDRFRERQSSSNLVPDDEIARNLQRMAGVTAGHTASAAAGPTLPQKRRHQASDTAAQQQVVGDSKRTRY